MISRTVLLWIIGLHTIVPYGTYHLFFKAQRDEYALLITLILFWIFGFWSVAGPILAAIKVRRVFRRIENAQSKDELMETIRSQETQDASIDIIASENKISRFLAKRVYRLIANKLATMKSLPNNSLKGEGEDVPNPCLNH